VEEGGSVVAEESLVRLVESPSTEPEPTSTDTSTSRSLRLRLMSCESCQNGRPDEDVEPDICGYYLTLTRSSSPAQQRQTESVDVSTESRNNAVESDVALTNETNSQSDTELAARGSVIVDEPAAETVVMPTTGDADVMSVDRQAQSAAAADTATSSSLPGNLPELFELINNYFKLLMLLLYLMKLLCVLQRWNWVKIFGP